MCRVWLRPVRRTSGSVRRPAWRWSQTYTVSCRRCCYPTPEQTSGARLCPRSRPGQTVRRRTAGKFRRCLCRPDGPPKSRLLRRPASSSLRSWPPPPPWHAPGPPGLPVVLRWSDCPLRSAGPVLHLSGRSGRRSGLLPPVSGLSPPPP